MEYVRIARIVNTFGIKGELKIISETDFPDKRFAVGNQVQLIKNQETVLVTIASCRLNKGTYIIQFEEFNNINQVEGFKDGLIAINQDQQHELENHAFYYHQIIGLDVYTVDGEDFGVIKDIIELGSNDVWVVKRREAKKKDALIPYIDDVVKEVNLSDKRVIVDLMEGLIDDED